MMFLTNDVRASLIRSVRSARMINSFSNSGSLRQSPGRACSSGLSSSNHSRKRFEDPTKSSGNFSNTSKFFSELQVSHDASSSHSFNGLSIPTALGALIRNSNISGMRSPDLARI
eukprot:765479-Hanusia_phi.AAC.1